MSLQVSLVFAPCANITADFEPEWTRCSWQLQIHLNVLETRHLSLTATIRLLEHDIRCPCLNFITNIQQKERDLHKRWLVLSSVSKKLFHSLFTLEDDSVFQVDRKITELRDEYPWDSLGISTVVDVGGGSGHVSMSLARVCNRSLLTSISSSLRQLGISESRLHRPRRFQRYALSVPAAADRRSTRPSHIHAAQLLRSSANLQR